MSLCEDNMTIYSPEADNIAVEGELIFMLPSYKGNNCFIVQINIFLCNVKK